MNSEIKSTDPAQLATEILARLGLSEHPFTEHAGEAYIYSDSQLEMTSNTIMEHLTNAAATIVLSGENGVGKTTYLRKILRLGYQQYQFCTLRAKESIDFEHVENKIKQRWILPATHEQTSIADLSIENYLITYLREHTHSALIIDDAHLLKPATLERLFALKQRISLAGPLGLGFILAGESSLKVALAALKDSNPACAQIYPIDVRPLSQEQTANYIKHRLKIAGLKDKTLLDDAQITRIYTATQGNIRQIHKQAIVALQTQDRADTLKHAPDANIIIKNPRARAPVLVVALTVAVIAVPAIYSYIKFNHTHDVIIPIEKPAANSTALPAHVVQHTTEPKRPQPVPLPAPRQAGPTDTNDAPLPAEPVEQSHQDKLNIVAKSHSEPAGQPDSRQNVTRDNSAKDENPASRAGIVTNGAGLTRTVEKPPSKSFGKDWLKQLEPPHYTLQVVATQDIKKLTALISKEKLTSEYAYFEKSVKDATFYVLVIGHYKTRNAALAAIKNLPDNLRKNQPWPVTLKSVQQHLD